MNMTISDAEQTSPAVQAATFNLFRESVNTLHYLKDEYSEMTELAIQEVFPIWIDHMRQSLVKVDIGAAFAEYPQKAWQLLRVKYSIFKVRVCRVDGVSMLTPRTRSRPSRDWQPRFLAPSPTMLGNTSRSLFSTFMS